ncbi:hypothetical protein HOD38_05280 [archaeon]|jgi:hypothetical protein|nr:hypothetical protein [archaeon]MBT4397652.1 hypothetical protein [archaeon]MBT4441652.1 hypothetical protein [archaeon]
MKKYLFFILILLLFVSACTYVPECGNGILDVGEDEESCCLDAGCEGSDACENNVCILTECGEYQELVGNECIDLECYVNSDCANDEFCDSNICEDLICDSCEYVSDHECEEYSCCEDDECDDRDDDTIDICEHTEEGDSYCLNTEIEYECTRDSHCDDDEECDHNECVELECTTDSDCNDDEECVSNECEEVSECSVATDCDQGYECSSEECVAQSQTDCGDDWDCLLTQSESCSLASYDFFVVTDMFGVEQTTSSYYELQGYENGMCEFYVSYVDLQVEYSDEVMQNLIDGGMTMEEAQQQEDELNDLYDGLEGREGSCMFATDDLGNLIENWSNGQFSGGVSCSLVDGEWQDCTYSGDWEVAEDCQGEYFNPNL